MYKGWFFSIIFEALSERKLFNSFVLRLSTFKGIEIRVLRDCADKLMERANDIKSRMHANKGGAASIRYSYRGKRYLFFERPHFAVINTVSFILRVTLFSIHWNRTLVSNYDSVRNKRGIVYLKDHAKLRKCVPAFLFDSTKTAREFSTCMHKALIILFISCSVFYLSFPFHSLDDIPIHFFYGWNIKLSILSSSPSWICMHDFYENWQSTSRNNINTSRFHFLTINFYFYLLRFYFFFPLYPYNPLYH